MNTSIARKQLSLAVACALTLGFASGAARANDFRPATERDLVTDTRTQVWKNGYGECWHSGFGPAPRPGAECDPNYVAQRVEPAPQPVAVTPPQALTVAAVAPAPVRRIEKVTLDADALFDFDKSVLRPEGRAALDGFVVQLQGVELETITAIGHTDRFGSDRYNQALSDQRAQAVKAYLVAHGVQSERVRAQGMGEAQPVTKAGDCAGGKNAKVIACLQPDRRVEVEVAGTRTTQ
ncbi:MAG: OmpA family protein [Betaproteobacteria bacterium]|nr:MAG: OmpA family protein [Betaproteobacteria bacterium]